ncbi:MAG TPA: DUF1573 domain-containing protein [Phycisphaerae bacterium]|nr:DUF1573 domain-containing protein [Phycisphaerae bacterium]
MASIRLVRFCCSALTLLGAAVMATAQEKQTAQVNQPTSAPVKTREIGDPATAKPTIQLKPGETPKIRLDELVYNFPKTPVGRDVYHEFSFSNVGTGPLEILAIRPSCGCTTAGEFDKIVYPGGKGKIPLRVATGALNGNIDKKVTVFTNVNGAEGTIELHMKGEVWEPLSVSPKTIGFGQVAATDLKDKMPSAKATIVNNSTYDAELTNVRCASTNFKGEVKVLEPHKKFEFEVTLVPPLQGGVMNGTFEIDTNVPVMPKLEIPVSIYISAEVEVFPARLPMPKTRPVDLERRFTIKNNGKNPIKLSDLKCTNPAIKLRMEEVTPGMAFTILMQIPKEYKVSPGGDVVSAKTDSPNSPLVSMIITEAKALSPFGAPMNVPADGGPKPIQPQPSVSSDQPK